MFNGTELENRVLFYDGDTSWNSEEAMLEQIFNGNLNVIFSRDKIKGVKQKSECSELDVVQWKIPQKYLDVDVVQHVRQLAAPLGEKSVDRANNELQLFIDRDILDVLCVMMYIVDTFKENNKFFGARGSAVASYVLYLIEAHNINSLSYNLDMYEFFKKE